MAKRLVRMSMGVAFLIVLLGAFTAGFGAEGTGSEDAVVTEGPFLIVFTEAVHILVFSALGLFILLVGFRALDLATPFSLNKEIAEDDNTAAGVVVAGMMIALGLIIHGALTSRFLGTV